MPTADERGVLLGHQITRQGITPNMETIRAIFEAPFSKNVSQLKCFVAMVMFIQNS